MSSAIRTRSRSIPSGLLTRTIQPLQESDDNPNSSEVQGLAGSDLSSQWDAKQFEERGRDYSREFMTRMHHPFGEVLGALFLDAQQHPLAYHTCFRGDRPSALSHLPGIAKSAQELGATRVVLAYNIIFDPDATLPDIRRMHARMHDFSVELYDFLLISPGNSRSLLAPTLT